MTGNRFFHKLRKTLTAFQQWFLVGNSHHGFAIVFLTSACETEFYKQQVEQIVQLLKAGYRVTIVREQEKTQCDCCKLLQKFCEEQLKNQTNSMPSKEHV